jgi:hypothetical protein
MALSQLSYDELGAQTISIDHGVAIAVQPCTTSYTLSSSQHKNKKIKQQQLIAVA